MSWEPLTKTFFAEVEVDGVNCAVTFDQTDWETALIFAKKQGWNLVDEIPNDNEIEELVAEVQLLLGTQVIH